VAKHRSGHKAIGAKIRKLKREGKTQKQAVGQALGMAHEGRLGKAAKRSAGRRPRAKATKRKHG